MTVSTPDGDEPVRVAAILVKVGDSVVAGQPLLELETSKAIVELPSPFAGTVVRINVSVGDEISLDDGPPIEIEPSEDPAC